VRRQTRQIEITQSTNCRKRNNAFVIVKEGETFERAFKRFNKQLFNEQLFKRLYDNKYTKPSEKKKQLKGRRKFLGRRYAENHK
jgi:ribosomal protein S21